MALGRLGALAITDFEDDDQRHLEATAGILTRSVRNFGPRYLSEGLGQLRDMLAEGVNEGVVGRVLTDFHQAECQCRLFRVS